MKRLFAAALIALCLLAQACTPATPVALVSSPSTLGLDTPTEYVPSPIPVTPTYQGCANVWGSEDLADLSRQLNEELQKTSTNASGLAYAFGENCVYGDGHQTFSAVETDFRIGVKVSTIRDEASLGDWIYRVMSIILDLPADQMPGSRPGRVDFAFKEPDPATLYVSVPIDKYRNEAADLRGADLLHLFYSNP